MMRLAIPLLVLVLTASCGDGGGTPAEPPPPDAAAQEIVRADLARLHTALVQFFIEHSDYPDRLAVLELEYLVPDAPERPPLDPWGEPYLYRLEDGSCTIASKGPDRTEGTADDVEDRRATYCGIGPD